MAQEKLKNFKSIIDRDDFNYISEDRRIREVALTLENLWKSIHNDAEKLYCAKLLRDYLEHFTSFYKNLVPENKVVEKNLQDLSKGYKIVCESIEMCIRILGGSDIERESISKQYCKKFSKTFSYGLTNILKGIRKAFEHNNLYAVNISRDQIIKYILDEKVGLGKRYLFNKMGKYSFMSRVGYLQKKELVETVKLLTNPSKKQIRKQAGWLDLGYGKDPIRILCSHGRVHFLFKSNEHQFYEKTLRGFSPKTAEFLAA